MKRILLETIPYRRMRYATLGDYFYTPQGLVIQCADLGNEDSEFLIKLHELIEEYLTRKHGIAEPDIMAFDVMFEKEREAGKHGPDDEPGNDPRAPYHPEHVFSDTVERLVAWACDIDWTAHERRCIEAEAPGRLT